MKKLFFFFLIISSTLFSQEKLDKLLTKFNLKNVPYISVEALAMDKTKIIILDAREEKEYKVSHIEDAMYVGYDDFKVNKTIKKLPNKEAKIVVYCSLGIRSETIAYRLMQKGYTNVYNLYGGIFEWKNNNFTVLDSKGNKTEKVHAFNKNWSKWLHKGEKVYE